MAAKQPGPFGTIYMSRVGKQHLIDTIRHTAPTTRIVALAGDDSDAAKAIILALGATSFMVKPIEPARVGDPGCSF